MSTVWDAVEALATCLCSEILNPDNGLAIGARDQPDIGRQFLRG